MLRNGLVSQLFSQVGIYSRSLLLFLVLAIVGGAFWLTNPLKADQPLTQKSSTGSGIYDFELTVSDTGGLFLGNNKLNSELLNSGSGAESIIKAENTDRKIIYTTIADQNNLKGAVETIEKVFAQVQFDKAQPGDKVQEESGKWIVK